MKIVLVRLVLAVFAVGAVTSCAAQGANQMYAKASALTKLSSAVEAIVLYTNPSPTLTDSELISAATEGSPDLLREFEGFAIRITKHEQGVIVLVCAANADTALLEDASCTAKMDRHHWRDTSNAACTFTLKLPGACAP